MDMRAKKSEPAITYNFGQNKGVYALILTICPYFDQFWISEKSKYGHIYCSSYYLTFFFLKKKSEKNHLVERGKLENNIHDKISSCKSVL